MSVSVFNFYLYVRVSTEQQDFLSQKLAADAFITAHPNTKIIKVFEEKSSAYNQIPNEMIKMILEIEAIDQPQRPKILVRNVDRFSRSVNYGTECIDKILASGTEIFFYDHPDMNVATPEGRARFNTMLADAENESRKISERVVSALKVRREAGYLTTKEPPFGKKVGGDNKLENCPQEIFIQGLIAMLNLEFTPRQILKAIRIYEEQCMGGRTSTTFYAKDFIDPAQREEIFYGNDKWFAYILNHFGILKRGYQWTCWSINYQWKKYIYPCTDLFTLGLAEKLSLIDDSADEAIAVDEIYRMNLVSALEACL